MRRGRAGDEPDDRDRKPPAPANIPSGTMSRTARVLRSRHGRPFRALQHRAFVVIWLSFLLGQLGFWVSNIALQWLVAAMTGADAFQLGLLWFFMLLPLLILSPFGGVIADRFDRKHVVVSTQASIAVFGAALAVLTHLDLLTMPLLYLLAFGIGCAMAINGPTNQAIIANAVPGRDLSSAISVQSAGMNLARVVGPGLGAPVLLAWGAAPAFAIYSASAAITSFALSRVKIRVIERSGEDMTVLQRIKDGLNHARERKPALSILAMVAIVAIFGASYAALLPVIAYNVLEGGDQMFTTLVIVTGAGAMLGAMSSGYREAAPRSIAATMQMLGLGLALIAFAMSRFYPLTLVVAAIAGGLNFSVMTTLNSMLQHLVDDQMRGRVMSLYVVCWGGLIPIGVLLIGAVGDVLGTPMAIGLFGGICSAFAVAFTVRFTLRPPPTETADEATTDTDETGADVPEDTESSPEHTTPDATATPEPTAELAEALGRLRTIRERPEVRRFAQQHLQAEVGSQLYRTLQLFETERRLPVDTVLDRLSARSEDADEIIREALASGYLQRFDGPTPALEPTVAGREELQRLRDTRLALLQALTTDWAPWEAAQFARYVQRLEDASGRLDPS